MSPIVVLYESAHRFVDGMAVLAECTSGKIRPTPMTSESDSFQAFKAAGNACFVKKDYEGALEVCLNEISCCLGLPPLLTVTP